MTLSNLKNPKRVLGQNAALATVEYAILAAILGLLMLALALTIRPASNRLFLKQTRGLNTRPVPYSVVPMATSTP